MTQIDAENSSKLVKDPSGSPKPAKTSRKSKLDSLARKMEAQIPEEQTVESKRRAKKIVDNYALGIEDEEDLAPDPKDVAKELDNESLYCEDEDSGNYSDDSAQNKGKKGRSRKNGGKNGYNRKIKTIKTKNKLFNNRDYDDYDDDDREVIGNTGEIELEFSDDENQKRPFKFEQLLEKKTTNNNEVLHRGINFPSLSRNALAEKGCPMKISLENIDDLAKKTEKTQDPSGESKEESKEQRKIEIPKEADIED